MSIATPIKCDGSVKTKHFQGRRREVNSGASAAAAPPRPAQPPLSRARSPAEEAATAARSPQPAPQAAAALRGHPRPSHGEGDVQLGSGPEGGQEGRAQEQRGGAHHPARRRRGGLQGPRAGAVGAGPGWAGELARRPARGRREPSAPFFSGCAPFLSRRSLFVRKCVCGRRCGTRACGPGAAERGTEPCRVHGRWCSRSWGRAWVRPARRPAATSRPAKQQQSLALPPSINNTPKMADIIQA